MKRTYEDARALHAAYREVADRAYKLSQEVEEAKQRDAEAAGAAIISGEERPASEEERVVAERREAERETAAFSAALTQRQADLLRLLGEETEGLAERAEAEIDKKLAAALKRSDALRARYAENMRERLASSALAAAVAHLPRGFNASGVSTLAQATEPDLVPETRAKRRHER